MGQAKGHQGLHTCPRFLGTGDRLGPDLPPIRGLSRVRAGRRRDGTSLSVTHRGGPGGRARLCEMSISAETWRVGVLVMPSGAVPEGRGRPSNPRALACLASRDSELAYLLRSFD